MIRAGAGVLLRPDVHTLELTGPDRARFLNGMITNDVATLRAGGGMLAVKTSAKGKVEAVLVVRASEDALWIDVASSVAPKVLETLDRYIIADDCAIADVTSKREVISVLGPRGPAVVAAAGIGEVPAELAPYAYADLGEVRVVRDGRAGVSALQLHVPAGTGEGWLARLDAPRVSEASLDVLRVEGGVPVDGRDVGEDTLPMEARLEPGISSTKGCYIGQEVIARATIQGHVNHRLVGLRFEGEATPEEGLPVHTGDGKLLGELCSVVWSPTLGGLIALAYVRRTHEAPGTLVMVGDRPAVVSDLPFVAA